MSVMYLCAVFVVDLFIARSMHSIALGSYTSRLYIATLNF